MSEVLPLVVVRFIGGRYNGYQGTVLKCCDSLASIVIEFDHKPCEIIEELRHLQPLDDWAASRNATELALKNSS